MANPKRRHSNTRTRLRRAHDFLTAPGTSKCTHCGGPLMNHRICPACGYYRGKQVLTIKVKEKKPSR
ncbi:MAG: 50S ribosomal protein L32 [Candidatus Omnitrophica bacterium]|nr:50S ribosomal protein L32 [Candidatus Omnitrophota bacterium]